METAYRDRGGEGKFERVVGGIEGGKGLTRGRLLLISLRGGARKSKRIKKGKRCRLDLKGKDK